MGWAQSEPDDHMGMPWRWVLPPGGGEPPVGRLPHPSLPGCRFEVGVRCQFKKITAPGVLSRAHFHDPLTISFHLVGPMTVAGRLKWGATQALLTPLWLGVSASLVAKALAR